MYIEKLNKWGEDNWKDFFSQFHFTKEQQAEVRQILTLSSKESIEGYFPRLTELGVLNGIGPGYLMRITRKFISWWFRGVKYEWHDIMYAIGGTESDRLDADYGLFKYSYLSIRILIIKGRLRLNPVLSLALYPIAFIQMILAFFCYIMVVLFGRFGSFRYIKNK